jgi:hypothetical protein
MAAVRSPGRYGADDETPQVTPRNDAYTGLLAISLFAMLIGCLLLFLDYNSYPEARPDPPKLKELPKTGAPKAPKAE